MPDEPTIGELARRLDRVETACERRAAGHVDRELYASERSTLRNEINGLGKRINDVERKLDREIGDLQRDLAEARKEDARTRRWVLTLVVTIVLGVAGLLATVLT